MRKSYLLFLLIVLLIPFSVFADCSDCSYNNCSDCGCVPSTGEEKKCVYSNISSEESDVSCGDGLLTSIPPTIPSVTKIIYDIIKVSIPILLVFFGSLDLIKAVIANKEDDIKKNQGTFIKRLISAVLVFFVFTVVEFVISLSANNGTKIIQCAKCFISGVCK